MKILQSGAAKSGNLWMYNLLQNVLRHAGVLQKSFIKSQPIHGIAKDWPLSFPGQADIDTLSINMPIDDIDAYIAQTTHVWTQSYFSPMSAAVFPKFDRVVYVIRDPRDIAISMSRFQFTPYRKRVFPHNEPDPDTFLDKYLADSIEAWARHVGGHLIGLTKIPFIVLFYERLLKNMDEELPALVKALGLAVPDSAYAEIRKETSFSSMREFSPMHVREGKSGGWQETLKPRQVKLVNDIAGPLLKYLGYPLSTGEARALPHLPDPADPTALTHAVRHAQWHYGLQRARKAVLRFAVSGERKLAC